MTPYINLALASALSPSADMTSPFGIPKKLSRAFIGPSLGIQVLQSDATLRGRNVRAQLDVVVGEAQPSPRLYERRGRGRGHHGEGAITAHSEGVFAEGGRRGRRDWEKIWAVGRFCF